jgi:hypothetical protein
MTKLSDLLYLGEGAPTAVGVPVGSVYINTTGGDRYFYTTSGWSTTEVALATQAEAQTGTSNTVLMTPLRTAQAIAALADANVVAPVTLAFAAQVTPDIDDGLSRKIAVTNNIEIIAPIEFSEGAELLIRLDVGASGKTLTLTNFAIPSESSFASPYSLTNGKSYYLKFLSRSAAWDFVSFVGGF